ncbi:lamin tail domain-containing protein [Luteolibacter marinus]|uniref:lamin tail domain-containing protein n=1 Tax=Luteolibacter marinus TaxID=2776705 RepID=UPI0018689F1F|nr:lamin tail domain-containing protein [Luteolibacter marinus]
MLFPASPRTFPLVFLLAAGPLLADAPDAVVTFNEIHYNPALGQDGEWIELHNQMAVNVDLSGWSLADGISYDFPAGTVIAGGGYLTIAKLPGHASLAGVPGVLGPFDGNLSNSGETIDLVSSSGRLMDRLEYGDHGEWPVEADGAGASLAKRQPGLAAADPANWRASLGQGGTPSGINFMPANQPVVHALADPGDTWRYRDGTLAPAGTWMNPSYNDGGWSEGSGPFASPSVTSSLGVTSDLVVRFRAGDVTGVADGGTFSPWLDSATGDGVSQDAAAGSNPQLEMNATPSGEAAVDFDGNDQFRTSATPGISPTSGFVYFVVCRANATPDSGGVGDGSGDYIFDRDAVVDSPLVSLKAVNGRYGFQKRFDNNTGLGGPVSTTSISTSQFQIVAVRRNPSLSRFEIWVDGVMEGTATDSGANLTPQPIVVGRHHSESTGGFNGDIAELLIYRNELSDADFQSVGAYLEGRYGLDTAFPDTTARTELSANASTAYFRKSFTYSGDPARTTLELKRSIADGAVFYLNGTEILRDNLPAGTPGHSTSALSGVDPPLQQGFQEVPSAALVNGTNVLAVSVHTGASDDSAYFSAGLRALEMLPDPDLPPALEINEIAGSSESPFFIEVVNPTAGPSSTDGFTLGIAAAAGSSLPSAVIPPGGVLHFTEEQLGFRPAAGDKVVLRSPGGDPVDAQLADAVARGRSEAWPERWLAVSTSTPGSANAFALQQDIVINEICYHPPEVSPQSSDRQWIELFNRGASAVDVGGWSFASGIGFTFPLGTTIAPGGYLVVAKDPANLTVEPGVLVLGPWSGNLAGSGEKIALLDSFGNPADEVGYLDGGRWPGGADGKGSSLELRDARADNSLPESWTASDESARRSWQNCSYRATAASSTGPDGQWREFIFGLLDSGDVLIDDIEVIENPDSSAVAMISNGDFESGLSGWRFLGNHRHAELVPDPDSPGNTVLHLSARGPTEHMHNHVETTLAGGRSVVNGREYEVRFRARWLGGSNRLNTRLYFNRVARTTELMRSDAPGTPGVANSTSVPNLGPVFHAFTHVPAVPAPGEAVTVTAHVSDPDGLGPLVLHYSLNGASFISLAMAPDASGSTFSAAIPGQGAADVVRFHVEASDGAPAPAVSYFPAGGAASHALYQVDDGLAATNGLQNVRIVMDPADENLLYQTNNLMSNERLGCTVIYGEREIYYDVGVRLKSSQRGRPSAARVGFNLGFNDDQLFRGVHKTVAIDRSDGQVTGCQEILYDHMMYASGGVPAEYNDLCQVIAPDPAHTSHAILQMARFNDVLLDSQFENGSDGTAYEYELIYYPLTTDANGYKLPQPDDVVGVDLTNLGNDKESYRWNFLLENNEDVDDYSRLIALAQHFDKTGAAFEDGLDDILDIDQWLRATAYACASGAGDSFFDNSNHNGIFYARPDGRMLFFPHDMDYAFSTNRSIFENSELQKLIVNPVRKRAYLGHLHEICTTVFNTSYMSSWAAHYGSLLPGEDFAGHLSYIGNRSNFILSSINGSIPPVAFAITTNGGANFSTSASPVILEGQGWIDIKGIRLAGSALPLEVTWTSQSTWQIAVPLAAGPNVISLEAVDGTGATLGTDGITVTNTGGIEPPDSSTLVVSEIYYNPPGSDEATEYVELMNVSASVTLDLSNVTFSSGITATFPGGTLLAPGGRILVVKDSLAFESKFGPGRPVAAIFPNSLDNAGELLELRRADGGVIQSFTYDDAPPWPVEADGDGYSLVLVDPFGQPDHNSPLSWRASRVADGGTPGLADTESYASWKAANGNHGDDEDLDGDGFTTREEYFLGGDPQVREQDLRPTFQMEPDGSFLMSVTRRAAAEGASVIVEVSDDMTEWTVDPAAVLAGNARLGGIPEKDRLTFRVVPPANASRHFARFAFGN